jgi:phenylpropionate dioxygenase-like ring-hydroxylating dioxygenase large terminal subunit
MDSTAIPDTASNQRQLAVNEAFTLEKDSADTKQQSYEMPAGGSDPNRFDCKEAWYPVYYLEDLDKSKPTPFTLLDRNIVIWWEQKAECWRVFEDKCPHRLAPLSEGRIASDGLLECPYHGWAFSGSGNCQRIPQQIEGRGHPKRLA